MVFKFNSYDIGVVYNLNIFIGMEILIEYIVHKYTYQPTLHKGVNK